MGVLLKSDRPFYQTEALQWLKRNPEAVVGSNFFHTNQKSVEGVARLYRAGAEKVEALIETDSLIGTPKGIIRGEICDSIEVTFPTVVPEELVSVIQSLQPDNYQENLEDTSGGNPYSGLKDCGGQVVILWWD